MHIRKLLRLSFLFFAYSVAQDDNSETPASTPEPMSTDAESDDEALNMCSDYVFPDNDFIQNNISKVYANIEKLTSGPFFDNNLTKYTTVFGVRVIGDEDVEDEIILHLTKILAKYLDNDVDGKPDHEGTVDMLRERKSTLFLVSDPTMPEKLLSSEDDVGFIKPLKECPFAFDFEVKDKIITDNVQEPEDCDIGSPTGTSDRSLGFVSDHVIGRSWPMFMTEGLETGLYEELQNLFDDAVDKELFDVDAAGCPEDDLEYCGIVMFSSWAATSYLGVDKCWCEDTQAWKLCTPQSMQENALELFKFLENRISTVPDGEYDFEGV